MLAWFVNAALAGEPSAATPITVADEGGSAALSGGPWAGMQITEGVRHVPVIGAIRSRTEVTTLAEVVADANGFVVVDHPCTIDVRSDHAVTLEFDANAVRNMPPVSFRFDRQADGTYLAGPWQGGWGEMDVDKDGVSGIRIGVKAPLCGGTLDVASRTTSDALASGGATGLSGDIQVVISRDILGASNPCLGLVDHHQTEHVSGTFAWVPVPAGSTCDSLAAAGWPARPAEPGAPADAD